MIIASNKEQKNAVNINAQIIRAHIWFRFFFKSFHMNKKFLKVRNLEIIGNFSLSMESKTIGHYGLQFATHQ